MIKHDKKDGNYIEIPAVFTNSSGVVAEPGTSFKLYVYPANSETAILDGVDLDEVGTSSMFSYTWDISSVSAGNYYGFIVAVDSGNTYATAINIDITDTTTLNNNISSINNTITTNLDAKVSQAGAGNGGITQPIYINDVDGTREKGGVKVEVFSSPDMSNDSKISGNLFTDDAGQIILNLNAGTYYLRASKAGKTFPNPIAITVSE